MTALPVDRGQTEPLAALVAVSMLAIGISVFAGYYTQTFPGTTDRTVEESTTDQIWTELQNEGVYEPGSLSDLVEADSDIVDYLNDNPRPEEAGYEGRPVPVKTAPGEVRGGRLHVVVWQ